MTREAAAVFVFFHAFDCGAAAKKLLDALLKRAAFRR
jgi:hypothetical protein